MATVVKKNIKGHAYYYVVQTGWVEGRSRVIWQKYLGKAEDIVTKLERAGAEPYTARVFSFGAVAALYQVAAELSVVEIIDQFAPKRNQGPSVGEYMLIAAINRAVAPKSKRQIGEWYGQTSLSRWLKARPEHLSSQRFWDHMGYLGEEEIRKIEVELTKVMVQLYSLDLRSLVYDTTNFFTWIDTATEAELPERGHNKQKRNDLRQVGLALMVTMDFAIPLFHQVYPGNRPDAVEFASVVDELVERYKTLAGECLDVTVILDKGNNSRDNVARLSEALGFVGSLVPSQHPDLLAVPRSEFRPLEGPDFGGVLAYRTRKEVFGKLFTVVVTYNEALYLGQMQGLVLALRKANQGLRELKRRLDERYSRSKPRGKPPTVATVRAQVRKILRKPLDQMVKWQVREEGGRIILEYEIDHGARDAYVEKYFGKNILFTNREEWTTEQIVLGYRGQGCIEASIKTMKDHHFIGWSPMYHWTDQKIRVHAFYCVLALTLTSLLRRRLALAGLDMSIAAILEQLGGIYEVAHIYPPQARRKDTFTLSEMNEVQRKLAQTLNLEAMHRLAS